MTTAKKIRAWAGTNLDERHVLAIMDLLEDTRTALADWRLHVASYRGWSSAGPRTDEERAAVYIGESYRPGKTPRRVLFAVPKEKS